MPKLSVIIPAFGNQKALTRSLQTLKVQTVAPHEVIVVDDGSPADETTGICAVTVPSWVKYVRIERKPTHRGSSKAKNFGATLATGTHLVFADSDILHLPDAIESLAAATSEWDRNTLLNVMRVGLPEAYPAKYYADLDELMRNCRTAGMLIDEERQMSATCWEQNCGMIDRDYFWELGGYDQEGFPSWGFNNQDLDCRVILNGGHVSSNIGRSSDIAKRLYCFHIWHETNCDKERAKAEWIAKWGEEFSEQFMHRIYALRDAGDISQYEHNIVRRAA